LAQLTSWADLTDDVDKLAPFIIIRLLNMTAIDATVDGIEDLLTSYRSGRQLVLCDAPAHSTAHETR